MQFSDNLCHYIKMRPTIKKIKSSFTYTSFTYKNSRTAGCFSIDNEHQFKWHNCLICGNYLYRVTPENITCKDIKHIRYNYDENIKEEIKNLIKIIEECDKCDDLLEHSTLNKKLLAVLSIKLAEDQMMNCDDHNNLLRGFGIYGKVWT